MCWKCTCTNRTFQHIITREFCTIYNYKLEIRIAIPKPQPVPSMKQRSHSHNLTKSTPKLCQPNNHIVHNCYLPKWSTPSIPIMLTACEAYLSFPCQMRFKDHYTSCLHNSSLQLRDQQNLDILQNKQLLVKYYLTMQQLDPNTHSNACTEGADQSDKMSKHSRIYIHIYIYIFS